MQRERAKSTLAANGERIYRNEQRNKTDKLGANLRRVKESFEKADSNSLGEANGCQLTSSESANLLAGEKLEQIFEALNEQSKQLDTCGKLKEESALKFSSQNNLNLGQFFDKFSLTSNDETQPRDFQLSPTTKHSIDKQRKLALESYLSEQICNNCTCCFRATSEARDQEANLIYLCESKEVKLEATIGSSPSQATRQHNHVAELSNERVVGQDLFLNNNCARLNNNSDNDSAHSAQVCQQAVTSCRRDTSCLGAYLREVEHKNQQVSAGLGFACASRLTQTVSNFPLNSGLSLLELSNSKHCEQKVAASSSGDFLLFCASDADSDNCSARSFGLVSAIDRVADSPDELQSKGGQREPTPQEANLIEALNLEWPHLTVGDNQLQVECCLTSCEEITSAPSISSSCALTLDPKEAAYRASLDYDDAEDGDEEASLTSECEEAPLCEASDEFVRQRSARNSSRRSARIVARVLEAAEQTNNNDNGERPAGFDDCACCYLTEYPSETATNVAPLDAREGHLDRMEASIVEKNVQIISAKADRKKKKKRKKTVLEEPVNNCVQEQRSGLQAAPRTKRVAQLGPTDRLTTRGKTETSSNIFGSFKESQKASREKQSREREPSSEPQTVSEMKAAKDLAKVALPSLASLQYLPGQFELKVGRKLDKSTDDSSTRKNASNNEAKAIMSAPERACTAQQQQQQQQQHGGHRGDSCLFLQRLCLCNCMGRPCSHIQQQQQQQAASIPLGSTPVDNGAACKLAGALQSRGLRCARSSLASGERKDVRQRQRGDSLSPSKMETQIENSTRQHEKQSPSFLSLLGGKRKRTSHAAQSEELHENQGEAQGFKGVESGRVGRGGRHCRAATSSEPLCVQTSGRHLAQRPEENTDDIEQEHQFESNNLLATIEAQASSRKPSKSRRSISATYRKLLAPSKRLFSSASSVSSSSVCLDHQPTSEVEDSEFEHKQKQRSLLSRSLGRLSGRHLRPTSIVTRRSGNQTKRDDRAEQQRVAAPRSSSACDQPLVSPSKRANSCIGAGSLSSLDSARLDSCQHSNQVSSSTSLLASQTRLLSTPEIVLSRVEYFEEDEGEEHSSATTTTSGMTRSTSSRQQPSRKWNYERPQRHTSELNFASQPEQNSLNGNLPSQGAFSLPGSPRLRHHQRPCTRLSTSPVPFHSPASESTKIEDGLRVCSTEHFEKHIGNIKDHQTEAQKRLFTAWINCFVPNLIRHDLIEELQDGIKLIGLLAALTHDKQLVIHYDRLKRDRQSYIDRLVLGPSSRLKHLSNVSIAIEFLRKKLGMNLVNLNPMDIVSGKSNVILGLCWNIILNFQLQSERSNMSDNSSELSNYSSLNETNSLQQASQSSLRRHQELSKQATGEFSSFQDKSIELTNGDLQAAKRRLLDHINKRFNFKLTNLTSSLLDSDVLLAIIEKLSESQSASSLRIREAKLASGSMSQEEKLDECFALAHQYLGVPRLFSGQDLKQQMGDTSATSKSLLVYLSMLLKSNQRQCSTDQVLDLRQLDDSLKRLPKEQIVDETPKQEQQLVSAHTIEAHLGQLEASDDKFHSVNLQRTLSKIRKIEQLLAEAKQQLEEPNAKLLLERLERLKRDASQTEALIDWINEADCLFEQSQGSVSHLAQAIDKYQKFFAFNKQQADHKEHLCPILKRQYRECLTTAKQRVLTMEQTIKNWRSYEEARKQLYEWLVTAESKLARALLPADSDQQASETCGDDHPLRMHLSQLDDLVEYFELEPINYDELLENPTEALDATGPLGSSVGATFDNRSLSNSLVSLGSNNSRVSTLANSKRAAYYKYFDNFELKCRLLAAMLGQDQKDELLKGARELKTRLKYITEHRVPQVVNELRLSVSRCEMSLLKQPSALNKDDDYSNELETVEQDDGDAQLSGEELEEEQSSVLVDGQLGSLNCAPNQAKIMPNCKAEPEANNKLPSCGQRNLKESPKINGRKAGSKNKNSKRKKRTATPDGNVARRGVRVAVAAAAAASSDKSPDNSNGSLVRMLWNRVTRASKLTISINIVLFICLAGMCVLPLMQKDACCELSQSTITPGRFTTVHRKPV